MLGRDVLRSLADSGPHFREAAARGNLGVLRALLGPAWRGLVRHQGKGTDATVMPVAHGATFDWTYRRDHAEMTKLYEAAKTSQWNGTSDLDWSISVDPRRSGAAAVARELGAAVGAADLPAAVAEGEERADLRHDRVGAEPVPARRAGRAVRRLSGHDGGAVDGRQALRLDAGGRRGTPRRGVPRLPLAQAGQALRDQRQPVRHHRRADDRLALGREVPRHADHDRGAGARRVRHAPPADPRAAAQGAPQARHHRRGAPRALRGAGDLRVRRKRASASASAASAKTGRSRSRSSCAIASSRTSSTTSSTPTR